MVQTSTGNSGTITKDNEDDTVDVCFTSGDTELVPVTDLHLEKEVRVVGLDHD